MTPRPDFTAEQAELDAQVAAAGPTAWFILVTPQQHRNIVGSNIAVPFGWSHHTVDRLTRVAPPTQTRVWPGPAAGPQ